MSRNQRSGGGSDKWNVNDIRAILHNPVYTGIGPYPAIVDDATWIGAQARLVDEDGLEATLLQMRQALMSTFGRAPKWMAGRAWLREAEQEYRKEGTHAYFARLLRRLREEYNRA